MDRLDNLARQLIEFEYEFAHGQMREWEEKMKELSPEEIDPDFHYYEEAYRYGVFDALITIMEILETTDNT